MARRLLEEVAPAASPDSSPTRPPHQGSERKERPPPAAGLVDPLTARELEVLRLAADGRSNRQIASELVIAEGTVKAHPHNICSKLGAADRVEAVVRAKALRLI